MVESLDPDNTDAWEAYHTVANRFVQDAGVGAAVFARLIAEWPIEVVSDRLERLAIIHDLVSPRRSETER